MLSINSVSLAYRQRPVLDRVSFDIQPGQIVALAGPNGAGKSTLIKAASGLLPPQSGSITINGRDLYQLTPIERARLLAVVPQARRLPPAFTVFQTVLLGRTPYLSWLGHPSRLDLQHTERALEQTQTQSFASRRVDELSGGEQQRVLLARALAQDTPILLLDEPTAHLDLQHQANLLNLIRCLAAEHKLAVLIAIHDLNLISHYADQVALLYQGSLAAFGPPKSVLSQERLSQVYQVPLHILPHPQSGAPLIVLDQPH